MNIFENIRKNGQHMRIQLVLDAKFAKKNVVYNWKDQMWYTKISTISP